MERPTRRLTRRDLAKPADERDRKRRYGPFAPNGGTPARLGLDFCRRVGHNLPMKFLDQCKIYIRSGDGAAGAVSFRREKFINMAVRTAATAGGRRCCGSKRRRG